MADQSSLYPEASAEAQMNALRFGLVTTQAIAGAASFGLADLVATAPKTADELAQATRTHAPCLVRLLRFLTSLGIFVEGADGKYRHTALSESLRNDAPRTLRAEAIMMGSDFMWRPWGDLRETIVTGQPAFDRVLGARGWDYLATHPDDAAIFNAAMTSLSSVELSDILAIYDFSRFERIVDVGGGQGLLLHGILSANPRVRGVLADQPYVVSGAAAALGPIADRCETVAIDFFESVPEGADAYIAKHVIHDWNDHDAITILRNCRRAIRPDGTMLLIEFILKPPNQPDFARFADLQMLVTAPGGHERTQAEFHALLGEAGFSLTRVIPTACFISIIESKPV
jgi:SAM-dependent methyltransferase